eukprot:TRINITY_DN6084_c0_g1_i1.p1 TRINITY_DN6084_c0_g1~~TRINITY_DN6084_c0_g1_i1.p1  ORF type:complete len:472 (+),score=121.73 TRINITY_DN6084_c0_g1_i1:282-1697(+)
MNPESEDVSEQGVKPGRRTRVRGNRTKQKRNGKKEKSPADASIQQQPIQLNQLNQQMPLMVMPLEVAGRPVSYVQVMGSDASASANMQNAASLQAVQGAMLNQVLASQMQQLQLGEVAGMAQQSQQDSSTSSSPRKNGLNTQAKPFQPQGVAAREESIAWTNASISASQEEVEPTAAAVTEVTDDASDTTSSSSRTPHSLGSPLSAPATPTIAASVLLQLDLSPTHEPKSPEEDDMWKNTDFLLPKREVEEEADDTPPEMVLTPTTEPTPATVEKEEHIEEVPASTAELEGQVGQPDASSPMVGMGGMGMMGMPMGMGMGMGMPMGVGMPMGMGMGMMGMQPVMVPSMAMMPGMMGGVQMVPVMAQPPQAGQGITPTMPTAPQPTQQRGQNVKQPTGQRNVMDFFLRKDAVPSPPDAPTPPPPPVPPQQQVAPGGLPGSSNVLDFFKGATPAVASDDDMSNALLQEISKTN